MNIEIHGLSPKKAKEIRAMVYELLSKRDTAMNDVIIEIHLTEVEDAKGREQPYFRLVSTEPKGEKAIKNYNGATQVLNNLMDVELAPYLREFLPRGEVKRRMLS